MAQQKSDNTRMLLGLGVAAAAVGLGLFLSGKPPGQKITINFEHIGAEASVRVGVGFSKDQLLGYGDIVLFKVVPVAIAADSEWEPYIIKIDGNAEEPRVADLDKGVYDAWVFIARAEGELPLKPMYWWPLITEPYMHGRMFGQVLKIS